MEKVEVALPRKHLPKLLGHEPSSWHTQDCTIRVLLPVSATSSNLWDGVPTSTSTVEKMSLFFNGEQVLAATEDEASMAIKVGSIAALRNLLKLQLQYAGKHES